ncbi:MAG TPA: PD-(D/E)XK nuclease family protein [Gemmataceae bacterium]|nr:PD-(D/E)XK nuclease family protein [Gemmataceae bacterium]
MSITETNTASPIRREFLGWDKPALPEAAQRLAARYRQGPTLDLSRIIVVVPGQRAGRRLQELLAFLCQDKHLLFTPPDVVTEGRLAEMLYTPKLPFANDNVQDLTWAQALRELPPEKQRHVVPHPPGADEPLRWLALAKVMRRLHVELAADGLDFDAVRKQGPKLATFAEGQRWEALVAAQIRYHTILDSQKLWDIQTARLKAIEFREIATDRDIILLGTVDLNTTLRQMLDLIPGRVTAYIVAPEEMAERFDAHGCLISNAWCNATIPLSDDQLRHVDGPVEQADAVTAWLGELGGRYRRDEVVIGVPDQKLAPQLQRQLSQSGVMARWVEGVKLSQTGPLRLLTAAVKFADGRRYDDLAALLRHADIEDWLNPLIRELPSDLPSPPPRGRGVGGEGIHANSLPAQLDLLYNKRLPNRISAKSIPPDPDHWPNLATALEKIENWLEETATSRPLRQWGTVFRNLLNTIYGDAVLDLDNPADATLHKTFRRIVEELDKLDDIPEALDTKSFSAADALQFALGALGDEALAPPADPDAVEMLGWLELPLDDSQALVVTSFNEGFVPQATGADLFLPDRLRRELGLLHNERRYARDAYATSVLCKSRKQLRVLVARRDTENDPLQPSRLLFACEDETLIRRARRFFAEHKTTTAPRRLLLAAGNNIPATSRFVVPPVVQPTDKLQAISVTRFRSYIACPYRYYLRHVRKLEVVDDEARELDGSAFGILLHGALSALGRHAESPRHSTDEKQVFEFLEDRLHAFANARYGGSQRRAAIRLQLEQARQRLKAFAAEQVALVEEGWQIVFAEDEELTTGDLRVPFIVDGVSIDLTGRIDRIDFHQESGTVRVLDYKTADAAHLPDKAHRDKEVWIDLQLPLYRHLWKGMKNLPVPASSKIELGYFNLPKQIGETGVALAEWDNAALAEADEQARDVIRNLRNGVFWPPAYPPPDHSEDFAAICLDNVMTGPAVSEEGEGGES